MTRELTVRELRQLRLRSQLFVEASLHSPTEVATHMLAMQGQDFPAVMWALGVRSADSTLTDVHRAFNSGEIVRGWPMRGTLHLTAARDLPWLLSLTADRIVQGAAKRRELLGIDLDYLERVRLVAVTALGGGKSMTRAEFTELMETHGFQTANNSSYHFIWHLSITGTLCWGPVDGKEQRLVLQDEWITDAPLLEREEALGELARRYFTSHGPSTVKDLAWWAGLPTGDVKIGLASAGDALTEVVFAGKPHFVAGSVLDSPVAKGSKNLLALPAFDEWLLGYRDRSAVLPAEFADRIVPGNNGIFQPTIVDNGGVVGTWKRATTKKGVKVTPIPFVDLSPAQAKAFTTSAATYARFLGTDLVPA